MYGVLVLGFYCGSIVLSYDIVLLFLGGNDEAHGRFRLPCVGPGQSPSPLSFHFPTSPPSTLSFRIFYLFLFLFLLASSIFLLFIPSHFTRIVPLRLQAGCRRKPGFRFFVFILHYMYFLVKDECLFL